MKRANGAMPAKDWLLGLDAKGTALFQVAAKITETNLLSGRPGDRAAKIKTSTMGLWELRVTKPGSSPPHHRLFLLREGFTLWATHGFSKKSNDLPASEIEAGERIATEWNEGREAR